MSDATADYRPSVLQVLVGVRRDERAMLALSALYFFLVMASYFILRPIRDQMGVAGGVRNLAWLFTGTLVAMLLVSPLFSALVSRWPRRRFVTWSYRALMLCLLAFYGALVGLPDSTSIWVGRAFFIWVSVFNLFAVSLFWAVMADVYQGESSRRLYGVIAAGGSLGALLGGVATAGLVELIGAPALLLVSLAMLEMALWCMFAINARVGAASPASGGGRQAGDEIIGGSAADGFRLALRSPYLLGICGYMFLYTIGSTFLYFLQADIVAAAVPDRAARSALFAQIDVWANAATLLMQVFVSAHLLNRFGIAVALCVLPLLSTLGYLALGIAPVIGVVIAFQSLRRMGNFALTQPARENLYFPLPREARYKAKNLIDTFMFRAGDQIGAWTHAGLGVLGLTASGISFVAAPISALWLVLAIWLGRAHRRLLAAPAATASASSTSNEATHAHHAS